MNYKIITLAVLTSLIALPVTILGMYKAGTAQLETPIYSAKPKYDQMFNDYTFYVTTVSGEQIGHITYGPSKSPYVPTGTWSLKSIRVHNDYQNQKIGFKLIQLAYNEIKKQTIPFISLVAVPRQESLTSARLIEIYTKWIGILDCKLLEDITVKPWPSDNNYFMMLIPLTYETKNQQTLSA